MLSKLVGFLSGGTLETVAGIFKDYQDNKLSKEELTFRLKTFEDQNSQDIKLAQIEINKTEAQHASVFVSGWRPFLGWTCGLGFAMNFLIAPVGTFSAALLGYSVEFPQADVSTMMPVLLGMLGLGGMRTFEKVKDKARDSVKK